ncbi:ATP-binding protein [Vagococcus entomophilus]|uniref:HAMP domain-containing sensor histidine kinase n=1 Tax=Vagococcus entomophilus TaxID=1160095 RepID=UPI000F867A67|nr:HAMP domain-containing sensor histidine kinase [Vagococcus entomophilus]
MRLSFKIFLSTFTIILLIFSISCSIALVYVFNQNYQSEKKKAQDENKALISLINNQFQSNTLFSSFNFDGNIKEVAKVINQSSGYLFKIVDENGQLLYASTEVRNIPNQKALYDKNYDEQKIKLVVQTVHYVVVASRIKFREESLYIENYHPVEETFKSKAVLINGYYRLLLVIICLGAILIGLSSMILTRTISSLSKTSRSIISGKFHERVEVKTNDEIGQLAKDFNEMTDKLEQKIDDVKQAKERQEEFMASFAHEVRTPLTSVIGYAQMLQINKMNKAESEKALFYILSEGRRINRLSNKLLELILLEKNKLVLEELSTAVIQEDIENFLKGMFQQKASYQIALEAGKIYADHDLLKILLTNVLSNSLKFLPVETGNITINGKVLEKGYEIEIIDNGCGIPAVELEKIREPFYRVEKSREGKNVGLGLSIVQKITEIHQAKWQIISQEGQGTTVVIRFFEGKKI